MIAFCRYNIYNKTELKIETMKTLENCMAEKRSCRGLVGGEGRGSLPLFCLKKLVTSVAYVLLAGNKINVQYLIVRNIIRIPSGMYRICKKRYYTIDAPRRFSPLIIHSFYINIQMAINYNLLMYSLFYMDCIK